MDNRPSFAASEVSPAAARRGAELARQAAECKRRSAALFERLAGVCRRYAERTEGPDAEPYAAWARDLERIAERARWLADRDEVLAGARVARPTRHRRRGTVLRTVCHSCSGMGAVVHRRAAVLSDRGPVLAFQSWLCPWCWGNEWIPGVTPPC